MRAWLTLLAGAVLLVLPASAPAQGVDPEAASQLRFTRGRDLLRTHQAEPALAEFRAALDLVRSPNTRIYIARCLRELNRFAEAYGEYQRAAAEAADRATTEPRYASTRDAARSEAQELEGRFGRLTVHVPDAPPTASVTVADRPFPRGGWEMPTPFDPGPLVVEALAPGYRTARETARVVAGQTAEVTLRLVAEAPVAPVVAPVVAPPPEPVMQRVREGGTLRRVGYGVLGLGVLGLGGTLAFGLMAQSRYDDLQRTCGGAGCGPEHDGDLSGGQTLVTLANVSLVVGLVGAAAGTVLVLLGGPREVLRPVAAPPMAQARLHVVPMAAPLGAQGGVVGLAATF